MDFNLLRQALDKLNINITIKKKNLYEDINTIHNPKAIMLSSQEIEYNGDEYIAQAVIPESSAKILARQTSEFIDMELDMQVILNSCRDVIFVSDEKGNALRVSSSWKELWEAEGLNFFEKGVFQVEKDGVISPSATRLVSEKKERVEVVQQTDTGRILMVTGTPILDEAGDIKRIVSISEDITEISTLKKENKRLHQLIQGEEYSSLVFNSDKMHNVLLTALKAAAVDSTVLITGESGVGKESIVDHIHNSSERAHQPIIKVNCGSIPEHLLESELFGYIGGAFTGALKEGKRGLFEAANGGTIFLDEIGDMALPLQVKILRVLQEQEVTRIGDTASKKIDVRIIAATNKNLQVEIEHNRFREDLYYRLNVLPIAVPPLRERMDDLAPLILLFTEEFNRKFGQTKVLAPKTLKCLQSYPWPGNIRELRNVIERLIVLSDENYIEPIHLPSYLLEEELQSGFTEKSVLIEGDNELTINNLVRVYRKMGITHGEWGLISLIFSYESNQGIYCIDEITLSEHLNCGLRQINKWLFSLREKGFLTIQKSNRGKEFDFNQLIEASKVYF